MSEIGKLIDDVTRRGLAIALKKLGYRKSGRTFYQVHDARTEIVNVQASKSNMGDTGTFAINLGVYFPGVAAITNALPITGTFPKEYDCTVRKRLGVLMDGDRDFWWTIDSVTNLDDLAANVTDAWTNYGLPWMERVSDLTGAHSELLDQKMFFVAAGISVLCDRQDEAVKLVRMAEARQPLAARRIQDWARQHCPSSTTDTA